MIGSNNQTHHGLIKEYELKSMQSLYGDGCLEIGVLFNDMNNFWSDFKKDNFVLDEIKFDLLWTKTIYSPTVNETKLFSDKA